jgi:hypothetical protein
MSLNQATDIKVFLPFFLFPFSFFLAARADWGREGGNPAAVCFALLAE